MAKGSNIIDDGMSITINFKWLLQIIVGTAMVVYAFWKIEGRIQTLERDMQIAMDEIEIHAEDMKKAEQKHMVEMEERMNWYEQKLNLNPFSWGKNKK